MNIKMNFKNFYYLYNKMSAQLYYNPPAGVKKFDSNEEGLTAYGYVNCDNDSSEETKGSRCVIVDSDDNRIVFMSYGYDNMYVSDQQLPENTGDMWSPIIEGCSVHLYYVNGFWHTSTNHKLDAYKSFWNSKRSFGEKFWDAVYNTTKMTKDEFCSTLKQNYSYSFLLPNDHESRLVCRPTYSNLFVTHVFDQDFNPSNEFPASVPSTSNATKFSNNDGPLSNVERETYVANIFTNFVDYTVNPGIIIHSNGSYPIMVLHSEYKRILDMRDNQPTDFFLLTLMQKGLIDDSIRNLFADEISELCSRLNEITKSIHTAYVDIHVKHQPHVNLPRSHACVVRDLHSRFINAKNANEKVSTHFNDVYRMAMSKDVGLLITILRSK
jgi:hypothetical protein